MRLHRRTLATLFSIFSFLLIAVGCQDKPATAETPPAEGEETAAVEENLPPPPPSAPEEIVVKTHPPFSAPEIAGGATPMGFIDEMNAKEYGYYLEIVNDPAGKKYRVGVLTKKGNTFNADGVGQTVVTDIGKFKYVGSEPTMENPDRVGWIRVRN